MSVCCTKFNYSQEYVEYRMREAVDRQARAPSKWVWRSNNCCDQIETTFNSTRGNGQTTRALPTTFGSRISDEKSNFRTVCARFGFQRRRKQTHAGFPRKNFNRARNDGNFLEHLLIIGDETWGFVIILITANDTR